MVEITIAMVDLLLFPHCQLSSFRQNHFYWLEYAIVYFVGTCTTFALDILAWCCPSTFQHLSKSINLWIIKLLFVISMNVCMALFKSNTEKKTHALLTDEINRTCPFAYKSNCVGWIKHEDVCIFRAFECISCQMCWFECQFHPI